MIEVTETCLKCKGTGTRKCPNCAGTGSIWIGINGASQTRYCGRCPGDEGRIPCLACNAVGRHAVMEPS